MIIPNASSRCLSVLSMIYPCDADVLTICMSATSHRCLIKNLIGGCSSFGALTDHLGVIIMWITSPSISIPKSS
ncbi:uncharacterized protein HD556DRAFT_1424782 [Suillus plorans]|uniref:Uncharacterized protein n=1 Tax=Suillus plorans TaxID=116603 RepID=A0A9P7AAF5_9AGAM|nr:uncharacterized protein HD556DRAFT_1424782 [Suillus plorans]KAG1785068.1 hypothetical protein HD556DRAFT_1424782 [Suillus plorans]